MDFWLAVQKIYNSAAGLFDRGVSARAFSLLFFVLACLELVVGLAINPGLMKKIGLAINFSFAFSPVSLLVLIFVAAALWLACFVLQDRRRVIREWINEKLLAYLASAPIVAVPTLKVSYRSTPPRSQDRPPRFTPRAKS